MLKSLKGFENAEVMRSAYAIEYDCADPTQMDATLEFKHYKGLYGAGQFNGSSGYEEAAAQGIVAGINAALKIKGEPPMILTRDSSYIGTLIDDLVTKGTNEPYRIMTSRSEYRLLLRQDNADIRLTPIGRRVGLVSDEVYEKFIAKKKAIESEIERAEHTFFSPTEELNALMEENDLPRLTTGISLADLIRRPALSYEKLSSVDRKRPVLSDAVIYSTEVRIKYDGYVKRQLAEVKKRTRLEEMMLPANIDYSQIKGLRIEAVQKLSAIRPLSVGQASRISGVSPADISVLIMRLSLDKNEGNRAEKDNE